MNGLRKGFRVIDSSIFEINFMRKIISSLYTVFCISGLLMIVVGYPKSLYFIDEKPGLALFLSGATVLFIGKFVLKLSELRVVLISSFLTLCSGLFEASKFLPAFETNIQRGMAISLIEILLPFIYVILPFVTFVVFVWHKLILQRRNFSEGSVDGPHSEN